MRNRINRVAKGPRAESLVKACRERLGQVAGFLFVTTGSTYATTCYTTEVAPPDPPSISGVWGGSASGLDLALTLSSGVDCGRGACTGHGKGSWRFSATHEAGSISSADYEVSTSDQVVLNFADAAQGICFGFIGTHPDGQTLRGTLRQQCPGGNQVHDYDAQITLTRR